MARGDPVPARKSSAGTRSGPDLASQVKVTASGLRWQELQRYSNRQQRTIDLDGFVGTLEIEGDLAPFGPLLRTAEVLHLGKETTFGLGRLKVG